MRLLANENIPGSIVDALRGAGHDIAWVRTEAPGITDSEVLALANAQQRLLLTFDKDFGELAFHSGIQPPLGVLLFRFALTSPETAARTVLSALQSQANWEGHFSVIEETRIRMRPLPTKSGKA